MKSKKYSFFNYNNKEMFQNAYRFLLIEGSPKDKKE